MDIQHLTMQQLEAGLERIYQSPKDEGVLELIVRRPQIGTREVLQEAELNLAEGVAGDTWKIRPSSRMPNGLAHPEMQLNIMNSRVIHLLAQHKERWKLAGDQLYMDLDLTDANLPAGTRLSIGSAIIQVTAEPHTGCSKFVSRFGADAVKFVNSSLGRQLHLRGINAKVIQPGVIRVGDIVRKAHN